MTDPDNLGAYNSDPDALAWARAKVQRQIDKLDRWHREATDQGKPEQAGQWRRISAYLRRTFIGGEGCVIAAFDHRLPAMPTTTDGSPR
jgi:hypothetical protein